MTHRHHFRDISCIFFFFIIFLFTQCKSASEVIVGHQETVVHYVDSVIVRDSIVEIPREVYYNVAWDYDTLHLETSLAEANAWIDSIFLRGEIHNKKNFTQKTEYIENIVYKDSIVEKEVPVPYEVEKTVYEKPWQFYFYRIFFWLSASFIIFYFLFKRYFKKFI